MSNSGSTVRPMDFQRPRKRDAEATRARILSAAKRAFSETGYSHTGIREVATRADTSSTLVLRYFGSKIGLFEAALRDSMPLHDLVSLPREDYAGALVSSLAESRNAARPMLMMAMASGDPEAAEVAARVFTELSIEPLGAALGQQDGKLRALQLSILAIGFTFFVRHLPLTVFSDEETDMVCSWLTRCMMDVVLV